MGSCRVGARLGGLAAEAGAHALAGARRARPHVAQRRTAMVPAVEPFAAHLPARRGRGAAPAGGGLLAAETGRVDDPRARGAGAGMAQQLARVPAGTQRFVTPFPAGVRG
jgi:hypothetical protein